MSKSKKNQSIWGADVFEHLGRERVAELTDEITRATTEAMAAVDRVFKSTDRLFKDLKKTHRHRPQ